MAPHQPATPPRIRYEQTQEPSVEPLRLVYARLFRLAVERRQMETPPARRRSSRPGPSLTQLGR